MLNNPAKTGAELYQLIPDVASQPDLPECGPQNRPIFPSRQIRFARQGGSIVNLGRSVVQFPSPSATSDSRARGSSRRLRRDSGPWLLPRHRRGSPPLPPPKTPPKPPPPSPPPPRIPGARPTTTGRPRVS